MFRAEIQLVKGALWVFVAECRTSGDAWDAIHVFAIATDYYAAQVTWPKEPAP